MIGAQICVWPFCAATCDLVRPVTLRKQNAYVVVLVGSASGSGKYGSIGDAPAFCSTAAAVNSASGSSGLANGMVTQPSGPASAKWETPPGARATAPTLRPTAGSGP